MLQHCSATKDKHVKTNHFFVIILCLISSISLAQDIVRVEIKGTIIVDRNELEGVTVYNTSSNKGTVADKEGHFVLEVGLNDRVQFAALQFKNFEVVIIQEILDTRSMTVLLVEQVNKLPEVIILPHDLTGNLIADVNSIALVNPNLDALYFGLDNLDKIEFDNEHLEEINNIALENNTIKYGINMVDVIGLLTKALFKPKKRNKISQPLEKKTILDVYPKDYLQNILSIPDKDIVEFIYFVEEHNFDFTLLAVNREFEFLNFLKEQQAKFVAVQYGKE